MMRRLRLGVCLFLIGCDGVIGDLGQAETPPEPLPPATTPPTTNTRVNRAPIIDGFACDPAAGEAPLSSQCRWTATDPEGDAFGCSLDLNGDGAPEHELENCAGSFTQPHTFASPGTFAVELTATDVKGMRAESSFTVQAVERPNRPPQIASFAATPSVGTVPMQTSFGWTVSDPDGDALTCRIDIGADGTHEYTLASCPASGTQAHGFTAGGRFDVVLSVVDAKGLVATQAIVVDARTPVGDVRVSRVEWGQSVIGANLKLVGNKPALVRIHVLGDRAGIGNVTVKAEGFNAGTSLGTVSLTGPATAPTTEAPADLSQQWRGTVPETWVAPGLELRVSVDPDDAVPETDEANNRVTVTPTVGHANVMQLTSVPIVHQGATGTVLNVDPTTRRIWPIQSVNNVTRAPYTTSVVLSAGDGNAWGNLLNQIRSLRTADGSRRYYYGFVRVSYGSGIAGIGYIGQPAATGRDDSLTTFVHELGHNMGRQHAPCGGVAGPDPSYPYAGARLGSYGYDAMTNRLIAPTSAYDLMSYCNPEWVSDYNYAAVQQYLESNPPLAVASIPEASHLLVSGRITPSGVFVEPIHRLFTAPAPPREGPYTLTLVSDEGIVRVPFDVDEVADLEGERHFSFLLPDAGPVRSLQIQHLGRIIYREDARPVRLDVPIDITERADHVVVRWDARTHPSMSIAHLSGEQRTTLALWLKGGEAIVRTDGLPPGGKFEISVSDGLNAVRKELDR